MDIHLGAGTSLREPSRLYDNWSHMVPSLVSFDGFVDGKVMFISGRSFFSAPIST